MLTEKTFHTGSVLLNYAEGPPSGSPLLMLHGVTARWQSGLPIIPQLSSRWQIYTLDFRGHGKSEHVPGQYGINHYVADTRAFIEKKISDPVIIFGHSLGGRVAMTLAAETPEKIRAIIVGDTPLSSQSMASRTDFLRVFKAWHELILEGLSVDELAHAIGELPAAVSDPAVTLKFKHLPGWDQAYLRYTSQYLKMVDPEILLSIADGSASNDYDIEDILSRIECPVLLLQGDSNLGALMTDADRDNVLFRLKSGSYVRIDGAGHDIHLQNAEPVRRAVTLFLESL